MTIEFVIWAFLIGGAVATIYTFYTKVVLGKLVRKLIEIDACSPETAISLEQIDYKMNSSVERALKKNSSFSQTVRTDGNGLFYINPEDLKKAGTKYRNDGITIYILLVLLLVLGATALICAYFFPSVIQRFISAIQNIIGQ